jgi:hypothetical protein
MKFKKSSGTSSAAKRAQPKDDKVVISSEFYENDRPTYICNFCSQTLIRLTDAGHNNQTYWCRQCQIEYDPEVENIRKESKLVVPDRNIEPAVTSIQNTPDVSIRHQTELRGGFAQLAKKGTIKFTSYNTTEKE